jgi:hypothetical protein
MDGSDLNQKLEEQRRETERLVYRWFRFKTRRALGLLYSLFAFLPLIGEALYLASENSLLSLAGALIVGVACSLAFRAAGYRGFGGMTNTIEMLQGKDSPRSSNARTILLPLVAISPLIGFMVANIMGEPQLYVYIAILWLVERVVFVWIAKRTRNPILDPKIEDWLVAVGFPVGALLSTLAIIPVAIHPFGFLLISPLIAFCGIKALYEAPEELGASLD